MSRFDSDVADLNSDCLDEFGDDLVYTPAVGSPFTVVGIPAKRSSLDFDPLPAQYVVRWCRLSDFPVTPAKGDAFTLASQDFNVFDVRFEEGGGGVYLIGDKQ